MLCVTLKHKKIVVGERHRRNSFGRSNMTNRRIGHPGFTRKPKMEHETTPFVPLKYTMTGEEQKEDSNQNNSADLRDLKEVVPEIVNGGSIEVAAERNGIFCRNGK